MEKIRVLVADKQALVRKGICALLESCENIQVVGDAANGKDVLEMVKGENPDILLLDAALPPVDGASVTRQVRRENQKIRILFLGENEDKECVIRGIKSGSEGYILKTATVADLIAAIMAVHKGGHFLYPSVAKGVVEEYLHAKRRAKPNPYDQLSDIEKDVLQLIADGYHSRQVSEILNLPLKTVQRRRISLMRKLNVHSQVEVVKYAIHEHLTKAGVSAG